MKKKNLQVLFCFVRKSKKKKVKFKKKKRQLKKKQNK